MPDLFPGIMSMSSGATKDVLRLMILKVIMVWCGEHCSVRLKYLISTFIELREKMILKRRLYATLSKLSHNTRTWNGRPVFDLVILGLGEDGHTASIFPGHPELLDSDKTCEVTYHPVTFQKRITLTGKVINNADAITFLVTGRKKEVVVEKLFKKDPHSLNYPAAYIVPVYGRLSWYIDKEAGGLL